MGLVDCLLIFINIRGGATLRVMGGDAPDQLIVGTQNMQEKVPYSSKIGRVPSNNYSEGPRPSLVTKNQSSL